MNGAGTTENPQKNEVEPYFIPYTKITQNGPKNIRAKTIKLLKENIGINFHVFVFGDSFLYVTSNHKQSKKINQTSSKSKPFMLQGTASRK